MRGQGLKDVRHNKLSLLVRSTDKRQDNAYIIVSGLCASSNGGGSLCGLLRDTLDRLDVSQLFWF